MSPKIEKIIIKYITKSASVSDLDTLSEWIKSPVNIKVFKDYVQTHYAINYSMNNPNTTESINRLLLTIRREKSLVYKLKKQPIFKYTAAAIIINILALTYFFRESIFSNPSVETIPTIVNTNTIIPGTDKATLTLQDGSVVALEKGNSYQTQNANSNGEDIVYLPVGKAGEAGKKNSKEIAYNYLTVSRGGQFHIVLSDGTEVWLNSESQLKYPVSFIKGETRQVELVYGEAYFDVSPSIEHGGSKFQVFNQHQEVEVLGTEFNIKAYKDELNIYTTLVEGEVSVSSTSINQILKPTEQSNFNLDEGTIAVTTVNVYHEVSWKDGIFSFKGKPLKDIMKVISRWYDIDVVFVNKELETITFKGVLGKDQDIEEILTTIKALSVLKEYKINGKTVILK